MTGGQETTIDAGAPGHGRLPWATPHRTVLTTLAAAAVAAGDDGDSGNATDS